MRYLIIATIGLFLISQNALAQRGENRKERWEKYRAEKVSFLTSSLDLSPEQAQKFWPVYNQMEKERHEAQDKRRDVERKVREAGDSMSEKDVVKLTREYTAAFEKEGTLAAKYNEEFLKILPPRKVLKIYQSENEFKMKMFQRYREQNRRDSE